MTIIVEDGTGKADAESYATVAQADTHLAARGKTSWAALAEGAKEAALRLATAYMRRYPWKGQRIVATQALDWPRVGVRVDQFYIESDDVPLGVIQGCIELAYRASTEDLDADLEQQVSSESVGPISVSYAPGSTAAKQYPAVDVLVARYVQGNASSFQVVRA